MAAFAVSTSPFLSVSPLKLVRSPVIGLGRRASMVVIGNPSVSRLASLANSNRISLMRSMPFVARASSNSDGDFKVILLGNIFVFLFLSLGFRLRVAVCKSCFFLHMLFCWCRLCRFQRNLWRDKRRGLVV